MKISDLISNNANSGTIKKGISLFESGAVTHITQQDSNQYLANVLGSRASPYTVKIALHPNKMITDCSCPYDWGGICKHIVATLLHIDAKRLSNQAARPLVEKKPVNTRFTSDPYRVTKDDFVAPKNLTTEFIYTKAKFSTYQVRNVNIDEVRIIITIKGEYYYDDSITVYITPTQDAYLVESTPSIKAKGISLHELTALIYIQEKNLEHLFDLLDEDNVHKLKLEKASYYGITDPELAQKYFEINLKSKEYAISIKKRYANLLPISAHRNIQPILNNSTINREAILIDQSNIKKEKNPTVVRFTFQVKQIIKDEKVIIVLPFVGKFKTDTTFYKTNLKPYSEIYAWEANQPEVSKEELELVSLSKELGEESINNALKKPNSLNNLQTQLLLLEKNLENLQKLFPKLQENGNNFSFFGDSHYYRMSADDLTPIEVIDEVPKLILEVNTTNKFVRITPKLKFSFDSYNLNSKTTRFPNQIFGVVDQKAFLMPSAEAAIVIGAYFGGHKDLQIIDSDFPGFFDQIISPLSKYMEVDFKKLPKEIKINENNLEMKAQKVYLRELNQFILISPIVEYGNQQINILGNEPDVIISENNILKISRDSAAEESFLETIISQHPAFNKNKNQDFLHLHIDDFVKNYWFLSFSEALKEKNIEVYGFNEFKNFQYAQSRPQVSINIESGIDWFDVDIAVTVGDTRVSLRELKKSLISKDNYIKLGDGKLAVLPAEWVDKLKRYLRIGKIDKENLQISKLKFNAIDELFDDIDHTEILKEIHEKKEKFKSFNSISKVSLPKVKATLRDYQKDGYQWLHFLHEFGWGGILADDMGLGKTLQIITFLRFLKSNGLKNNLVVVPTSLLFNWKNELEKFCPSIRFSIHHGSDRNKAKIDWKKNDLIITTYGIISSDISLFSKQKYDYVILDESQAIKNPSSKRFKAMNLLKATNRLALTGTPIENNTFDLYAQMSFVNPGLFVSAEGFKKDYAIPIDKNGDEKAAAELNKMIHPFMLRRTKEMVATELPPKTEDIIYCNMDTAQRKVYDAYRNEYRNNLINMIDEDGLGKSKLHVLQALTKLRQICNSPALLKDEESYGDESIKIKELIRHIREKTGNHKLLIFSQFVKMLELIKIELEKLDISYSYLDGKTSQKNRKKAVDEFQENKAVRTFLISLKAGGTGLNLTAADYVYIVDPWWNPAVENQAIDRCYRIGQDKKVIAYRMICKDTLEEKIMNYKGKKQAVADAIIQTDENIMKKISKDDIMDLFG